METGERRKLLRQILWDYNISEEYIEADLKIGNKTICHYNREMLFLKIIESYPWFTVIQIFSPDEIQNLLTHQVISKLRSTSLRKKYEFVKKRLQQIIPNGDDTYLKKELVNDVDNYARNQSEYKYGWLDNPLNFYPLNLQH